MNIIPLKHLTGVFLTPSDHSESFTVHTVQGPITQDSFLEKKFFQYSLCRLGLQEIEQKLQLHSNHNQLCVGGCVGVGGGSAPLKVLYHASTHAPYSFNNLEFLTSYSSLTVGGTRIYYSPNYTRCTFRALFRTVCFPDKYVYQCSC